MYLPAQKEFVERAREYNLIPVYKEYMVDTETPTSIFIKAGGLKKEMFLLESVEGEKTISRYSIIGVSHNAALEFASEVFTVKDHERGKTENITGDPLAEIENIMKNYHIYKDPGLNHFTGGAVGYLGYDLVHYFENIPLPGSETVFPEILLVLTNLVIIFDHLLNRMKIISTERIGVNDNAERVYLRSVKKIESLEKEIFKKNEINIIENKFLSKTDFNNAGNISFNSNLSKDEFVKAVLKAKKYIHDGEIFQVVLSQKFSTNEFSEPFNIYRTLRSINPSPYMYYMNFGNFKIIGSSPEPLLKINGKKIQTYPIAGTRKRGKNSKEDRILINELLNDEKEKAEHNMLVDLARNDLGRVCRYGSVKVKKYMGIEKYSNVIHLVSRVEGTLDKNKTIFDAIKSAFPAGTLSGAPKIRAMQIISELEPDRRNIYGGIIGYFGYDGSLNTCITIRTAVINDKTAYIQAGAGIVNDSEPENEWEETLNKAGAIFRSINAAN
ncbi:anthranilate synthase component I [bacterium]|nr:anthranilate synthase component I [bacterium]